MSNRLTKMLRRAILDNTPTGDTAWELFTKAVDPHAVIVMDGARPDDDPINWVLKHQDEKIEELKAEIAKRDAHIERLRDKLVEKPPIVGNVGRVILDHLKNGEASIPCVVKAHGIPAQTVRRHMMRFLDEGRVVRERRQDVSHWEQSYRYRLRKRP